MLVEGERSREVVRDGGRDGGLVAEAEGCRERKAGVQ